MKRKPTMFAGRPLTWLCDVCRREREKTTEDIVTVSSSPYGSGERAAP
jgi:hypothetical protein